MQRFLGFVVECSLSGRGSELKEYTLGTEVFDRGTSYDPRIDPIVRVEARRLRAKLQRYYETTGARDSFTIELPKGGYVPVIAIRNSAQPRARTVAVRRFASSGQRQDVRCFAHGLTQQVVHRLTRLPNLRVVSWNSNTVPFPAEWEFAGLSLLTGSVRCTGDRLRAGVQLTDVRSHAFLWSEFYDGSRHEPFGLEENLADAIAAAVARALGRWRQAAQPHRQAPPPQPLRSGTTNLKN
jgi:serine/threonine-protein kinase